MRKRVAPLERRQVVQAPSDDGAVVAPEGDLAAGIVQGVEDLLVQQLIAQAAVKAFDEGPRHGPRTSGGHMARCCGLPGSM